MGYTISYMEEKLRTSIKRTLQAQRKKQRYTQEEVAEAVGITTNYYALIEQGRATPSLVTIFEIMEFLDLKTLDVLPKKP